MLGSAWRIVVGTSSGARWLLRQGLLIALGVAIAFLLRERARAMVQVPPAPIAPPRAAPPTPRPVSPAPHAAGTLPHAAPFPTVTGERSRVRPVMSGFAAMLVLALVITQVLNSHATAFNELSPVRVLADALHLLAAGLWSGGVLALAIALVPLLRENPDDPDATLLAWAILRRFGALAAAGLATLLITGLFMSGQQVASLDALLTALYGQVLLLKVGLALCVALIGLLNAATLHPRVAAVLRRLVRRPEGWRPFASRRLTRTVALEAVGALCVLLLAATLSATQPARGPEFDPPAEESASPGVTTTADDLVVTLAVKPNRPGQNFISLGVFNTRRPAPAPIDTVAVGFLPPGEQRAGTTLTADLIGAGRYQLADDSLNAAGDWRISVTVSRRSMADTTITVPWTVLTALRPTRSVMVSNRPLAPALTRAAVVIVLLLGGALATLWLGRLSPYVAFMRSFMTRRHPRLLRKD